VSLLPAARQGGGWELSIFENWTMLMITIRLTLLPVRLRDCVRKRGNFRLLSHCESGFCDKSMGLNDLPGKTA
jgi:hypothetical protein